MSNKQNTTLELFKLFASYMVISIHLPFYGNFGITMDALARFVVPLFFLVSGFFSYGITPDKIKRRIKNIAILLVVSTVSYTLFNLANLVLNFGIDEIVSYFSRYLNFYVLAKLLVFNVPLSSGHLWYLFAILYVYIIFFFVTKFRIKENVIFVISFLLLALQISLGEVLSAFGNVLPIPLLRNFALVGIPFFGLGLLAKKHENKLHNTPTIVIILLFVTGVIESLFSRYLFGKNELYFGSILILFAIVAMFIKYSNVNYPRFLSVLTGCSTYIYIYHLLISSLLWKGYEFLNINRDSILILNIHPIAVCISSTIIAYCIIRISHKVKKRSDI